MRDAIEELKQRIHDERVPEQQPAGRRPHRRTLLAAGALVVAAAVGLAVAAVASSPSAPSVASYVRSHVARGTTIGEAPGVRAALPAGYPSEPVGSAAELIADQPHWMLVANPPGADSATAWTVVHGSLAVSTAEGRLYSVVPPARSPPAKAHAPPPAVRRSPPQPSAPPPGASVTVSPGENFWTIAERVVAQRIGRPPTASQVAPVWQAIIAANAGRLTHPGDPNLVFPGQVFVIPPP